jgi:hypothetical protein
MKCWLLIGAFYETIPFEEARLRRKSLAVSSPRTPFLDRKGHTE